MKSELFDNSSVTFQENENSSKKYLIVKNSVINVKMLYLNDDKEVSEILDSLKELIKNIDKKDNIFLTIEFFSKNPSVTLDNESFIKYGDYTVSNEDRLSITFQHYGLMIIKYLDKKGILVIREVKEVNGGEIIYKKIKTIDSRELREIKSNKNDYTILDFDSRIKLVSIDGFVDKIQFDAHLIFKPETKVQYKMKIMGVLIAEILRAKFLRANEFDVEGVKYSRHFM